MALNLQTIKDIRNFIAGELKDIYPEPEVRSLTESVISYTLDTDRIAILRDPGRQPGNDQVSEIIRICKRLRKGEPIQYITGETTFYNCKIRVGPGTLIPRPETEELVDVVIKENRDFTGRITDIGTGSGCIAVALASVLPRAAVTAIDISEKALETAAGNALINNVKITFLKADMLRFDSGISLKAGIIVSNPPYVMESEKLMMHSNVIDYEPHEALFVPDDDPLLYYRAILDSTGILLEKGGRIYFEINEAMGSLMRDLMGSYDFHEIIIIKDINGKDRIVKGVKNG